MKPELVRSIQLPNDEILGEKGNNYTKSANELVTGVADKAEVEFVIDNLQEAIDAAHEDFCCNGDDKNYFIIDTGTDTKYEMTFDLASLKHLFGIFGNIWESTPLYNELLRKYPKLVSEVKDKKLTWLDILQKLYNPLYKIEIMNHECSTINAQKEKLNWQKIMLKIFSFINVGKLEDGTTFFYKEVCSSKQKPSYLIIRSLRNGELEDINNKEKKYYNKQLVIKLAEEEYIKGQICLTPVSIYIINKNLKADGSRDKKSTARICLDDYGIKTGRKVYKYNGNATITRVRGEKYAKKVLKNRIQTFKEYVEMFGEDEDSVELYLYDFIAFTLKESNKEKSSTDFINLFDYLLSITDENNTLNIQGKQLTYLYNFTKRNGLPKILEELLTHMYYLNEEKRDINYKINYKYYNNKEEYNFLINKNKYLESEINNNNNYIHTINNKYINKNEYINTNNDKYEYEKELPSKRKGK